MKKWIWLLALVLCVGAGLCESPKPALEMQRSVSKQYIAAGDSAVLSYRIENTGNVQLYNVRVTDVICGKIGEAETLAPGEYRTYQVSISVLKECMSQPGAKWEYDGMTYERTLDPIALVPAASGMKAALSLDRQEAAPGEMLILRVAVQNTGNTPIGDIILRERTLGEIGAMAGSILPGQTREAQLEIRAGSAQTLCITASGVTGAGESISATSNEETLGIAQAGEQASLRLQAAPMQDGTVELTIENTSGADILGVTISERESGSLRTLQCVAPGKTVLRIASPLKEAGDARFLARFALADGSKTTVLSNEIALGAAQTEEGYGDPVRLGTTAYAALMYAGIGALVLLLAVLGARRARRLHRKKRLREKRARRMAILRRNARLSEEEWVQTRPHKAVSAEQSK